MATSRFSCSWGSWILAAIVCAPLKAFPAEPTESASRAQVLTNASAVRELMPNEAGRALPVRLKGVVTFFFSPSSFFVQDESAGIYVGSKTNGPSLKPGDLVLVEGVSDPGDYAPI